MSENLGRQSWLQVSARRLSLAAKHDGKLRWEWGLMVRVSGLEVQDLGP